MFPSLFPFFCAIVLKPGFPNFFECQPRLLIGGNFPDPTVIQHGDEWYAFSTNHADKRIPVAKSSNFESWTVLDTDALAGLAPWETENHHWAPGVTRRDDGRLIIYYSGESKYMLGRHCVGAAISEGTDPAGPYFPVDKPIACHLAMGGAIDAAGFVDQDGSRYVVYKIDGNANGNGGDCGNSIPPLAGTPIMLQRLEADGVTKIGDPLIILDRDDSDGPLVEAPSLIFHDGLYFLFYSSHCFSSPQYDIRYATSRTILGPYKKASQQLLKTGDYGLTAPGHAEVLPGGNMMVFHANCEGGRCTYGVPLSIAGEYAWITGSNRPPQNPPAPEPAPDHPVT
ncbi:hypothetical protein FQN52_000130 [Onygenales sp. PD_12]|nr:hypothetical protein FQN52_000130 [Onygenales sp. PD_12]